jgi:medium-chain acyl-[acyl-carrier-protein] hydrolase
VNTLASTVNKFFIKTEVRSLKWSSNKKGCTLKADLLVVNKNNDTVVNCRGISAKSVDTGIKKASEFNCKSVDIAIQLQNILNTDKRTELILTHIKKTIADTIKADVSKINSAISFKNLGIDSLTTVQLRNIFEKDFKVAITVKDLAKFSTPKSLAWFIFELLRLSKSSTDQNDNKDPWFDIKNSSHSPHHQLILFNDAGGSSHLFDEWSKVISDTIELIIIEMPGHGNRIDETPINNYNQLMDIIIPKLNKLIKKPFSIYGHSMGGLIAFETASILNDNYGKTASNLIISGTPYLYKYNNQLINTIIETGVSDEDLRKLLPGINDNTPDEIANKFIRAIRADFELIYSYHYNNSICLNTDIIAIHAQDDDRVNIKDVKKWNRATNRSFQLLTMPGKHSFVYNQGLKVAKLISSALQTENKSKKSMANKPV